MHVFIVQTIPITIETHYKIEQQRDGVFHACVIGSITAVMEPIARSRITNSLSQTTVMYVCMYVCMHVIRWLSVAKKTNKQRCLLSRLVCDAVGPRVTCRALQLTF
jgi:hypothetical protein